MDHNLTTLLSTLLETFSSAGQNEQQKQQLLMATVMQVLFGNWAPFELTRGPVVAFLTQTLEGDLSAARRAQYTAALANSAFTFLMENPDINLELAVTCVESADPMGFTKAMLEKHLPVILTGYVEYVATPELSFANALRQAVTAFVGEWFAGLGPMMADGPAALTPLLTKLIGTAAQSLAVAHPQHGPMLSASAPMLVGWLMGLAQQRSSAPPAA